MVERLSKGMIKIMTAAVTAAAIITGQAFAADASAKTMDVVCVGDLMCLSAQLATARTSSGYSFDSKFKGVRKVIRSADLAIGNLETPVSKGAYTAADQKGNPVLNAPVSYLEAVKNTGFDWLATANNHCRDKGKTGIIQTLDNIAGKDILQSGMNKTGDGKKTRRYFVRNVNGVRIAFIAYTDLINSTAPSFAASEEKLMINHYSKAAAQKHIANAINKGKAQFVIVYIHWGTENTHAVNSTQTRIAQELADAGADVIIGSHPHCLQPIRYTKVSYDSDVAVKGKRVLTAYSLGNFISSMPNEMHHETIMLRLKVRCGSKVQGQARSKEKSLLKSAEYLPSYTVPGSWKLKAPSEVSETVKNSIKKTIGNKVPMVLS